MHGSRGTQLFPRRARRRQAIALAGAIGCALVVSGQSPTLRNGATVYVHVTVSEHIPGVALNELRREANRIWDRHRIRLVWGTETVSPQAAYDVVVPVVFDHGKLAKWREDAPRDVLARAVFHGRERTVYVSVRRARRMMDSIRATASDRDNQGSLEVHFGTLLGRVVAHELGHVLLTSTRHAPAGLMKAVFGLRDVLSGHDAATELSTEEASRLAMRFSLVERQLASAHPR